MAVRDVIVRLFGDDKDLTAKLDNADRKLSDFARSNPSAKLSVNDDNAKLILDDLKAKLTDYGRMSETARLKVDDTQALAAIDRLDLKLALAGTKLDSLGKNMDLSGLAKARSDVDSIGRTVDRLGGNSSGSRGRGGLGSGLLGKLAGWLFSGGGGGGGGGPLGEVASGGGGSAGKDALSALGGSSNYITGGLIGALIAAAASITPAILPFALGGGVGIGGALGALTLGRTAGTKITADKQALAAAQAALAGSKTATPSELLALHQAQHQLSHDQGLYGGFLPFNSSVSKLGRSAIGTFLSALTSNATGPHGGSRPGTSFLSGITGIVNQIGPFLKSMGPELGQMFRASLPFVQTMVKIMEQFAKAVMPAITQSMKELKPYLPQIMQGFKFLSQGIADFIKDLGPGMRTSVTVFKALMDAVKGILIGLAYTADALAWVFSRFGHNIMVVSHDVHEAFDAIRHIVAEVFDYVRHRVAQDAHDVVNSLDHWRHDIAHIFDDVRHDISSIWDRIWADTVGKVKNGIVDVIRWFSTLKGRITTTLHNIPAAMEQVGRDIINGLLNGLKAAWHAVTGWISSAASSVSGLFKSILGIASPSRVMHEIGLNIGRGLALGMDHSKSLVDLSSSRLAQSIPAMFTRPGAHGGRVYAGGSNMGGLSELIISAQGDALLKAIVRALRYDIKTNGGGNVQRHLGWGSV